jgi:hypothetical protein
VGISIEQNGSSPPTDKFLTLAAMKYLRGFDFTSYLALLAFFGYFFGCIAVALLA